MRCHSTSWARYTSPEFWRGTTEGKDGYLFTTRAGRLLDQRNSLKALHGAGNRGGFIDSALSLCGTSQGRRTGEPDQTVDGPFAELDGPLRRAITARHGLSSRMVRESWFGI